MKKLKKNRRLDFINSRGFTLIEMILGLLIFSIIAVSLYSTFSMAISVWKKSEDVNRIYREAKWSLEKIASSLKNADFFDFTKNYPDIKLFSGQSDKVSFYITSDTGLKKIGYSLEKLDKRNLFSLEEKTQDFVGCLSGQELGLKKASLTSLVKEEGLKFSYAYRTIDSEATETLLWKDSFAGQVYLPRLVKIALTLVNPKDLKQEKTFTKIVFIPTGGLLKAE